MASARPFNEILEDIQGLCHQLADAHSYELATQDVRAQLPIFPPTRPAPLPRPDPPPFPQPSAPGSVEEVPAGFFGVLPTAKDRAPAAVAPKVQSKWTTVQKSVGPPSAPAGAPAPVKEGTSLQGRSVSSVGRERNWKHLSIAVKKEQLAEDLQTRAVSADIGGFKEREIWNIGDEDILRIKRKARLGQKTKATLTESERPEQRDWFIIHPQSFGRLCWDLAGIVWLAYDVVMLPIQVFPMPEATVFVALDYLGNIYWTADMAMSFLTGTYSKSKPILRFKLVAEKYMRSWFAFDVFLVLVGWSSVIAESMTGDVESMASATRMTRFLRILRYMRLARLLRIVKSMRIFSDLQARTNTEMGIFVLGVVKLNGALMLMSHVLACSWYGIGNVPHGWVRTEGSSGSETGIVGWDVGDQYLYAYQWSLARLHPSSIKDNLMLRTTNERIFAIFGGLCAMVVGAGFISTITNMMREFSEKHQRRKKNLQLVQSYVVKYTISLPLAVRAKKYIELEHEIKLRWQREAQLMTILPRDLLLDFTSEAFSPVTAKHDFFAEIHSRHLRTHYDICHRVLSSAWVVSGEIVFAAGDAGSTMRFVTGGKFCYAFRNASANIMQSPADDNGVMENKDEQKEDEDEEEEEEEKIEEVQNRSGIGVNHTAMDVERGSWLSEAVLWTPWEHRGAFYAENGGTMLEVNFREWETVFKEHEQAHVAASIHARVFVEELNAIDAVDLSDLPVKYPSSTVPIGSPVPIACPRYRGST